ncbi:hypothetical protein P43SY_009419 [Pythium insidiosum]|uniref:Transmembrane protein n=1 Tax=Pythium insidiosum TaxID=114742 RepID=A0AAD5LKD1_PYTIN|nr:hypothetical protein P43SY_009419 [Pythium insidiosum]
MEALLSRSELLRGVLTVLNVLLAIYCGIFVALLQRRQCLEFTCDPSEPWSELDASLLAFHLLSAFAFLLGAVAVFLAHVCLVQVNTWTIGVFGAVYLALAIWILVVSDSHRFVGVLLAALSIATSILGVGISRRFVRGLQQQRAVLPDIGADAFLNLARREPAGEARGSRAPRPSRRVERAW